MATAVAGSRLRTWVAFAGGVGVGACLGALAVGVAVAAYVRFGPLWSNSIVREFRAWGSPNNVVVWHRTPTDECPSEAHSMVMDYAGKERFLAIRLEDYGDGRMDWGAYVRERVEAVKEGDVRTVRLYDLREDSREKLVWPYVEYVDTDLDGRFDRLRDAARGAEYVLEGMTWTPAAEAKGADARPLSQDERERLNAFVSERWRRMNEYLSPREGQVRTEGELPEVDADGFAGVVHDGERVWLTSLARRALAQDPIDWAAPQQALQGLGMGVNAVLTPEYEALALRVLREPLPTEPASPHTQAVRMAIRILGKLPSERARATLAACAVLPVTPPEGRKYLPGEVTDSERSQELLFALEAVDRVIHHHPNEEGVAFVRDVLGRYSEEAPGRELLRRRLLTVETLAAEEKVPPVF